jgi:hypothetical protein
MGSSPDDIKAYANYGFQRLSDIVTNKDGKFHSNVTMETENFMNTPSNSEYATNITKDEQEAYTPSLNWAKVWRLRFGGGRSNWDNWRNKGINHLVKIEDNVHLISEKNELAIDAKQQFKPVTLDQMSDFGPLTTVKKVVKGIGSIAATAAGFMEKPGMDGIVTSRYGGLKGLSGLEPLAIPGSLTFTFYFGQAGMYDATKEVVLPILALAGCVMAYSDGKYHNMFRGQVPGTEYLAGKILRQVIRSAAGEGPELLSRLADALAPTTSEKNDASEKGSSMMSKALNAAAGAANTMTDVAITVNDTIYKVIDNTYSAVMNGTTRMAYFKLGVLEIGPCYIESTSINFDFSATDSNGMPTKGTITYNGISTPLLSTAGNLHSMLSDDFIEKAITNEYHYNK